MTDPLSRVSADVLGVKLHTGCFIRNSYSFLYKPLPSALWYFCLDDHVAAGK